MGRVTLVDMNRGQSGIICAVNGGQGLCEKLDALGVRLGKRVTKLGSVFSRGPVTVSLDGFQAAIGYGKATRILVEVDD